jgi:predicted NBD/HSP70 family sugar kinase
MRTNKSIALDIGGSHITAALVDLKQNGRQSFSMIRSELDAFGDAQSIIKSIAAAIQQMIDSEVPSLIGIAFPGPFIYDKGISAIGNVGGKFRSMFGMHVKEALRDISIPDNALISFSNDAHCFAVGASVRYQAITGKTLFLTLGTGLGSALIEQGELVKQHPAFGPGDGLFDHRFADASADDYFSSRWFLEQAASRGIAGISTVKQLAGLSDPIAQNIFNDFGRNLGSFLIPVLNALACTRIIIGGNISKASALFDPSLRTSLLDGGADPKNAF